ncbi:MAG TPA: hypothetical protein VF550_05300 [Polyangia bacterium]
MKGFLLGLLVAGLGIGGYFYWQHLQPKTSGPVLLAADAGAPTTTKKARKRSRGAMRVARGPAASDALGGGESEPEPVRLSASDLRLVAQGDDLSKPDVLRLDMSSDKELPELSQDQIDERFRGQESAILDCISRARPDPETYVPGRVTIKFRIQRVGTVRGVRVEGPAVLQKNGLFGCVKNVVGSIRFPSAGTSQIVSYPFTLS